MGRPQRAVAVDQAQPSQAQPGAAWHTRSLAMQVLPHAFPARQVRQQARDGANGGGDS